MIPRDFDEGLVRATEYIVTPSTIYFRIVGNVPQANFTHTARLDAFIDAHSGYLRGASGEIRESVYKQWIAIIEELERRNERVRVAFMDWFMREQQTKGSVDPSDTQRREQLGQNTNNLKFVKKRMREDFENFEIKFPEDLDCFHQMFRTCHDVCIQVENNQIDIDDVVKIRQKAFKERLKRFFSGIGKIGKLFTGWFGK